MKIPSTSTFIPLRKALSSIGLYTIIFSGFAFILFFYYRHLQKERFLDPTYLISEIRSISSNGTFLPSIYLEELLGLSQDSPVHLYSFNLKEARQRLLASPLFFSVTVNKQSPSTIEIRYTLREPIAKVADLSNTAVDFQGYLFPSDSLSLNLPSIYLGMPNEMRVLKGEELKKLEIAFQLIHFFSQSSIKQEMRLKRIDLSRLFASSYGKREIIVTLEGEWRPLFLRLSIENFLQELQRYQLLRKNLPQIASAKVVDLRLPQLALVNISDAI